MSLGEPRRVVLHFPSMDADLTACALSIGAGDPELGNDGLGWTLAGMVLRIVSGALVFHDGRRLDVQPGLVLVTAQGLTRLDHASAAAAGDDRS